MHHLVNGAENGVYRRLAEVIAIRTICGSVLFCCDGNGGAIEVFVTTLNFKHLLHHIRGCTTWNVFIEEYNSVGGFQTLHDAVVDVKRQQSLYVYEFYTDAMICEQVTGFLSDAAA